MLSCLQLTSSLLLVYAETSVKKIEDSFKEFTNRDDIAIVMINQFIADMIRQHINSYIKVGCGMHALS